MNRKGHLLTASLFVATASPLHAADRAPQALFNKTVSMTWTTSGNAKCSDGSSKGFSNTNSRVVYVSTAGRPFLRTTLQGGKRSRGGEVGPGEATARTNIRFEADKLVGVETFSSGARQFTATFDASYSNCTLSIVDGRGSSGIRRRSPGGVMCDIENAANTGPQCSIQSGNAFSGQ